MNAVVNISPPFFNSVEDLLVQHQKQLFETSNPDGHRSKSECESLIWPLKETLCTCVLAGFADQYVEISSDVLKSTFRPSTRSICVYDFIWKRLRTAFLAKEQVAGSNEVAVCSNLGIDYLYVSDKVVVRVKKLSRDLLVMPTHSEQGRDWYNNVPIQGIPDDCTRLTVGYTVSKDRSEVENVWLTMQLSVSTLAWSTGLLEESDVRNVHKSFAVGDPVVPVKPIELNLKASPIGKVESLDQ